MAGLQENSLRFDEDLGDERERFQRGLRGFTPGEDLPIGPDLGPETEFDGPVYPSDGGRFRGGRGASGGFDDGGGYLEDRTNFGLSLGRGLDVLSPLSRAWKNQLSRIGFGMSAEQPQSRNPFPTWNESLAEEEDNFVSRAAGGAGRFTSGIEGRLDDSAFDAVGPQNDVNAPVQDPVNAYDAKNWRTGKDGKLRLNLHTPTSAASRELGKNLRDEGPRGVVQGSDTVRRGLLPGQAYIPKYGGIVNLSDMGDAGTSLRRAELDDSQRQRYDDTLTVAQRKELAAEFGTRPPATGQQVMAQISKARGGLGGVEAGAFMRGRDMEKAFGANDPRTRRAAAANAARVDPDGLDPFDRTALNNEGFFEGTGRKRNAARIRGGIDRKKRKASRAAETAGLRGHQLEMAKIEASGRQKTVPFSSTEKATRSKNRAAIVAAMVKQDATPADIRKQLIALGYDVPALPAPASTKGKAQRKKDAKKKK